MIKIQYFAALLLLTVAVACQYPVDNSTLPASKQFIVIDAEMTESYGKVNVTYTLTDVTSQGGYLFPKVPKTAIYVTDSRGVKTVFVNGTTNTTFKGIVGETYKLFVDVDGKKYESKPETMLACPELDSVTPQYQREVYRSSADLYYDGFDVYAQFKDIAGKENYYQWDWIHYEHADYCDKKFSKSDGQEVLFTCNPFECWNIYYNTQTIVQSDKLRDGQPIAKKVVRVPYATPPNKYYLRVEQRAITANVYAYLQSLETQTQSTGTLFDIPAQTRFSPNIYNVNDLSEQILGVFSVFSFRRKVIYVDRTQKIDGATAKVFPESTPFTSDLLATSPCIEGLYRTRIKPEGWKD